MADALELLAAGAKSNVAHSTAGGVTPHFPEYRAGNLPMHLWQHGDPLDVSDYTLLRGVTLNVASQTWQIGYGDSGPIRADGTPDVLLYGRADLIGHGGGDVTSWNDRGPQGYTAAPLGAPPAFVASDADWNGHTSIQFDRDNFESLQASGAASLVTDAFTVCIAVKYDIDTAYMKCWGFHGPAGDFIGLGCDDGGRLTIAQVNGPADVHEYGFVTLDNTEPHVITCVCTPRVGVTAGTVKVYDGATELTLSASTNIAASAFNTFVMGTGLGHDMEGSIAECVVISQALTAPQVAVLAAFVAEGKF